MQPRFEITQASVRVPSEYTHAHSSVFCMCLFSSVHCSLHEEHSGIHEIRFGICVTGFYMRYCLVRTMGYRSISTYTHAFRIMSCCTYFRKKLNYPLVAIFQYLQVPHSMLLWNSSRPMHTKTEPDLIPYNLRHDRDVAHLPHNAMDGIVRREDRHKDEAKAACLCGPYRHVRLLQQLKF